MATPKKRGSNSDTGKQGDAGKASTAKTAPSKQRGGLAAKVTPDQELAAIVGKEPLTRADLTKRVWDYIKSNDLQDAKDRRKINADAKMKKIFGKDSASMFEMTKLVNQHVS